MSESTKYQIEGIHKLKGYCEYINLYYAGKAALKLKCLLLRHMLEQETSKVTNLKFYLRK